MTISAGTRLGPYEVVALLGAGGMGEVFKARDTRLDRTVAIKVLPEKFANDAQLKLRFEREARTISQLNHPNICTLHDVGSDNGVEYLVMELLDGESLADRLARGPLPFRDVLRYGIEISDALDKAHHAGVVHRDLKPGNVVITKSGAKLLDFGLAKTTHTPALVAGTMLPTEAKPLTQEGTILGTFQYMAPEQLEGSEADARSDIFALGALLYEMATGKRAFEGKTRTSLIAAIVSGEPKPISALQPLTPPAFEQVVRGCLAKDADERIQTAHDVVLQLRWISETFSQTGTAAPRLGRPRKQIFLWPLAVAAAAALAWFGGARWQRTHTAQRAYRVTIQTPEGSPIDYDAGAMALSLDGTKIVYAGLSASGTSVLLVRKLTESGWRILNGTSGARSPFWSPDGTQIGFCLGPKVMKISAEGSGSPDEIVTTVSDDTSPMWTSDGRIVWAAGGRLYRAGASAGGDPVALPPIAKNAFVSEVRALPDGRHLLCTTSAYSNVGNVYLDANAEIFLVSIDGGEPPRMLVRGRSAVYANGHLFFMRAGMLYAQPFDVGGLRLTGEPKAITKVQDFGSGAAFSVTEDELVFLPEGSELRTELQRVDRTGKRLATIGQPAFYFSPQLSHDGSRIAVDMSATNGAGDIWIYDMGGKGATRFTFAPENESLPVWAPDDREIAYIFESGDQITLMRKRLSGGGATVAADEPKFVYGTDWSPDGKSLLASTRPRPGDPYDISSYLLPRSKPLPFVTSRASETSPRFSRDGRFVAYASNESGRDEIYVQPFPANGSKWQISSEGGYEPVWSRTRTSLFFISAAGKLSESALTVNADGTLSAQPPQPLFPVNLRNVRDFAQYDVAPDDTFLLNAIPDTATSPMTMILNWKSVVE